MPTDLMGPSGTSLQMPILLDIATGMADLEGWSYGVCHDFTQLVPTQAINGSTTDTVQNGTPAGFVQIAVDVGSPTEVGGVSVGVVICLIGCATLPAGLGYELMLIDYDLIAPNGTDANLSFCDTAGAPPVATVVVVSGQAIVPTQLSTSINIDIVPFVLEFGTSAPVEQGGSVTLPMILNNSQPVYGFSFGVENDPAVLAVTSVDEGTALAGFNGGEASFFHEDLSPSGGTGFTLGCVFSFSGTNATLPPGGPYELATATYDVLGSAPLGDTILNFVETLSPPAPAPPVALRISIGDDSVVPVISSGFVTVEEGGVLFVRGDLNNNPGIDLSDPIGLLNYLFSGGIDPTCFDAGDFDDSGAIDIGDAINLLGFLFSGGGPPAGPFPDCGVDPSGDADGLACVDSASCP